MKGRDKTNIGGKVIEPVNQWTSSDDDEETGAKGD